MQLIEIVPRTLYEFDAREGTTTEIVLKERVPTLGFASGVLVVRVHGSSGFSASAAARVIAYNQSVDPNDPATFFVDRGAPVVTSEPIEQGTDPGTLLVRALQTPISSSVRVVLQWAQGGTAASGVQIVTIGVDLVGRS